MKDYRIWREFGRSMLTTVVETSDGTKIHIIVEAPLYLHVYISLIDSDTPSILHAPHIRLPSSPTSQRPPLCNLQVSGILNVGVQLANMGSNFIDTTSRPFRVLVLGGSYAGLSAALNLRDLSLNRSPRCGKKSKDPQEPSSGWNQPAVEITIVDERDGFCKRPFSRCPRI